MPNRETLITAFKWKYSWLGLLSGNIVLSSWRIGRFRL